MPERCGSGAQGAASSSSTSTRGNTASQNIDSPPSPFDVETVLDAVSINNQYSSNNIYIL